MDAETLSKTNKIGGEPWHCYILNDSDICAGLRIRKIIFFNSCLVFDYINNNDLFNKSFTGTSI